MIKLFVLTAFGSPLVNAQPKSNRIKLFPYFWLFNMFLVLWPVLCLFCVKKRSLKVERNKQQNQDSLPTNAAHKKYNQSLFSSDFVSLLFLHHTLSCSYIKSSILSRNPFFLLFSTLLPKWGLKFRLVKSAKTISLKLCNFDLSMFEYFLFGFSHCLIYFIVTAQIRRSCIRFPVENDCSNVFVWLVT